MTLKQFIREHKEIIDGHIEAQIGKEAFNHYGRNNHQREIWINNDEALFDLALSMGVKLNG